MAASWRSTSTPAPSSDLKTGAIRWATRALPFDAWNVACGLPIPGLDCDTENCPDDEGPDFDFGQGPALFSVRDAGGEQRDLVGAGQKSGMYWALDPASGAVAWSTQVSPGGLTGGLQWGSATGTRRRPGRVGLRPPGVGRRET